jgi:DNA-directed RNA polymerase subunit K/omega
VNKFEYVIVSGARAKQLLKGCTPKVDPQIKPARTAMKEVKQGKIEMLDASSPVAAGE